MLTFNIAVVFPGQGSQSVGMLKEYAETWNQVEETYKQASEVLGYDLWDIVCNGPEEKLNQTEITQPAMLAADVSVMRIMRAVSYTHLTLPTMLAQCRSRWSPYH